MPVGDRAYSWYDALGARGRVVVCLIIGTVVVVLLRASGWPVRLVAGWDAACVALLTSAWVTISAADPAQTRRRAAAEDPGRTAVWIFVIVSGAFSIGGATLLLPRAGTLAPESTTALVSLCLLAVVSAWLLTHSAYSLRYAHVYYRDDHQGAGGMEFPGKRAPDDLDFAYFSFTVGMCYQTSDVTVSSFAIRRMVLVHAIISFAYNTVILALALNLIFALFAR